MAQGFLNKPVRDVITMAIATYLINVIFYLGAK